MKMIPEKPEKRKMGTFHPEMNENMNFIIDLCSFNLPNKTAPESRC